MGHDRPVTEHRETRRVVILTYPGLQPLDVVGPAEVFEVASEVAGGDRPAYRVEVVGEAREPLASRGGAYEIVPARTTASVRGPIDTLVVAGGNGVREQLGNKRLVTWVRSAARRSRRITSVCSGTFLLAEAGLLEGKRATTHWDSCDVLARLHPEIDVDPEPIFIHDGAVWTSAGVTAGMDLALALVEDDLGREVAVEVARWLVLFLQRPGGQAQFSTQLRAQAAQRDPLRELQLWIADHLGEDLRVEALAERAAMSPRNFARAFRDETGRTPAAYVTDLRVERARQLLEDGAEPVERIASLAGFGTPETMRRAFARRVGVSPADYRARFKAAPATRGAS